MVAAPAANPVTTPDPLTLTLPPPTLQVPPVVASVIAAVADSHILLLPLMAAGAAITVTALTTVQPVPSEYDIVVTPVVNPVTIPLNVPIDAASGLVLDHDPPVTASLSVVVPLWHTVAEPIIAVGAGLTVTTIAVVHPVGNT